MPTPEVQTQNVQVYSSNAFSCTVPASIPSANVSWYRGDYEVESSSNIGVTLSHGLVFSCIENSDLAPWKCYVSNQFYSSEKMLASDYLLLVESEFSIAINYLPKGWMFAVFVLSYLL